MACVLSALTLATLASTSGAVAKTRGIDTDIDAFAARAEAAALAQTLPTVDQVGPLGS